jgi:hypothetical protein
LAKRECLEAVRRRYRRASRAEKKVILDEVCANCGFHRKHAIRALSQGRSGRPPKPNRAGPPDIYHAKAVLNPLKKSWLTANRPCGKGLKAMLPLWLPGYEASIAGLTDEVRAQLLSMPAATLDRVLRPTRLSIEGRGRCTTKPGTLLRQQVPIQTSQWHQARRGYLEADTVAHYRTSMAGAFAYTLDCVDIATEWRLYHNFYCASVKLLSKERVGSKTIKKHDVPKTPYQRVVESKHVSDYAKDKLKERFEGTNPFELCRAMEKKLKKIFETCKRNPSPEPETAVR